MLFINNDEVEKVLTMEDTLRVIEEGHKELARGELAGRPRVDKIPRRESPRSFIAGEPWKVRHSDEIGRRELARPLWDPGRRQILRSARALLWTHISLQHPRRRAARHDQ